MVSAMAIAEVKWGWGRCGSENYCPSIMEPERQLPKAVKKRTPASKVLCS